MEEPTPEQINAMERFIDEHCNWGEKEKRLLKENLVYPGIWNGLMKAKEHIESGDDIGRVILEQMKRDVRALSEGSS